MSEKSPHAREVDCKDGQDVAKALMCLVNRFDDRHVAPFVIEVTNDHRTLQQGAAELFLKTLMHMAFEFDKGFYDARNEAACRLAVNVRGMLEAEGYVYKKEDGSWSDFRLPCI